MKIKEADDKKKEISANFNLKINKIKEIQYQIDNSESQKYQNKLDNVRDEINRLENIIKNYNDEL